MGISLCETPAKENAKTSIWTKYSKQTFTQPRRLGPPANNVISRPCGPSSRAPQRRSDAPKSPRAAERKHIRRNARDAVHPRERRCDARTLRIPLWTAPGRRSINRAGPSRLSIWKGAHFLKRFARANTMRRESSHSPATR